MRTMLFGLVALFTSVVITTASAATYADGAKEIQERIKIHAEQVCRQAKDSAACYAEHRMTENVAAIVQVRYLDIVKAMAEGNLIAAAEARLDVRAHHELLLREWFRLISTYK